MAKKCNLVPDQGRVKTTIKVLIVTLSSCKTDHLDLFCSTLLAASNKCVAKVNWKIQCNKINAKGTDHNDTKSIQCFYSISLESQPENAGDHKHQ